MIPCPFTHPANEIDQVGSEIKDMGKFYMIKDEVINNPELSGVGLDTPSFYDQYLLSFFYSSLLVLC